MKSSSHSIKLLTALAALTLCMISAAAQETETRKARNADEAAIHENVKQMEAGWNAKKGELFAKPFADDADYVVINGMYFQGRAAIEKAHQQIFDTSHKRTTLSLSVRQIRFLRPDVALVHLSGHLDALEKELAADGSMTLVMTRGKDGWQIAAFQNTSVRAKDRR
ncbi:MAG TPA: SgcJ/EcaC family oxidoreductase [Pyrinomonadaceae bacterium]|nr:SgcJ/EcaC family oxidoreductase [Pyrinomonadaceae bacterium]